MHSVRLEPTKSVLIGSRTTYQATGDALCPENVEHAFQTDVRPGPIEV